MKKFKRKTAEDHYANLSPAEQRRIARKSYTYQLELRQLEVDARSKMSVADAWADKFSRQPMLEDPDNLRPQQLPYDQMAQHSYFDLIEDSATIADMQNALRKRRLEVERTKSLTKAAQPYSWAKMLGENDPDEGKDEAETQFQVRKEWKP